MNQPRRILVTVAADAVVLGASVITAHCAVGRWPEGVGAGLPRLDWTVAALFALGLAGPGFLAAGIRRSTDRRSRTTLLVAVLLYGGAALVALAAGGGEADGAGPALRWLVLAPLLPAAVLIARRRWRAGLAAAALVLATAALLNAPHAAPGAAGRLAAWIRAPANRPLAALALSALAFAGLRWSAFTLRLPRAASWWGSAAAAVACWPLGWLVVLAPPPSPSGLDRIDTADRRPLPEGTMPAFAGGPADLGSYCVRSGTVWREAVLLPPPARVDAQLTVGPDGAIRLFAAVPRQWTGERDRSVRVRLALHGQEAGEASVEQVLPVGDASAVRGSAWKELVLSAPSAAGQDVSARVEALPTDGSTASKHLPVVAVAVPPSAASADTGRPSCLVILVDTLRADRLHCYGFDRPTSPNIDRLAAQGVLFERAISTCSWTTPSVASLFTGTFVSTHGVSAFRPPVTFPFPTLAERFRRAGYRTAGVSANVMIYPGSGLAPGFQEYVGSPEIEEGGTPRADWVTDHAIRLLRSFGDGPFFLYLHYMDPHYGYQPPEGWVRFGADDQGRYLGEIAYCDHEIGRLLDALEAGGRARNTLVVFIADHGEAFLEHGQRFHGYTVHREEVHVPLVLRLPNRIPAGRRVAARVRSIDAHATIAATVGLPPARHVEGESLVPLFRDAAPGADRSAFIELWKSDFNDARPALALVHGRHKLIVGVEDDRRQLYDVAADPDERVNLAREQPVLAAAMERRLRRFLDERAGRSNASARPLSDDARRRLRALGYLAPPGGDRE